MKLIECVPNFSEGRRPEIVARIAGLMRSAHVDNSHWKIPAP